MSVPLEDNVNLLARQGALELLALEYLIFQLIQRLCALRKHVRLSHPVVPSPVGRCNEVGNAARRKEGGISHLRVPILDEAPHLLKPNPQHGCLAVLPKMHAVRESCPQGNHVLERSANLDAPHVVYQPHSKEGVVKHILEQKPIILIAVPYRALAEAPCRHLARNVGAHQDADVHPPQLLADQLADEHQPILVKIQAFDQRNPDTVR
mmetsp:Transcript_30697/g.60013  ORF Transcript_30697/g.60013 Transcript_30697/m.60013 type:complete len:208 (-) Transcript_30697:428-1051(-)